MSLEEILEAYENISKALYATKDKPVIEIAHSDAIQYQEEILIDFGSPNKVTARFSQNEGKDEKFNTVFTFNEEIPELVENLTFTFKSGEGEWEEEYKAIYTSNKWSLNKVTTE